MSKLIKQTVPFRGAPVAWVFGIAAGAITLKWSFNNLADGSTLKAKEASSSSSSSSDNTDFVTQDGRTWRFPKENLILDADTEEDITPAAATSDATSLATMTLVTAFAPTQLTQMAAFDAALLESKNAGEKVVICLGLYYTLRSATENKKPDAYGWLLAKNSGEIDFQGGKARTLTYDSYRNTDSGLAVAALTVADLCPAQTIQRGGTGKDVTGVAPPVLTEAQATAILAGKPVIQAGVTYAA